MYTIRLLFGLVLFAASVYVQNHGSGIQSTVVSGALIVTSCIGMVQLTVLHGGLTLSVCASALNQQ